MKCMYTHANNIVWVNDNSADSELLYVEYECSVHDTRACYSAESQGS